MLGRKLQEALSLSLGTVCVGKGGKEGGGWNGEL